LRLYLFQSVPDRVIHFALLFQMLWRHLQWLQQQITVIETIRERYSSCVWYPTLATGTGFEQSTLTDGEPKLANHQVKKIITYNVFV